MSDGLGHHGDIEPESEDNRTNRLGVSTEQRVDDVFRVCCDTNSQTNSMIDLIKVMRKELSELRNEVGQLKAMSGRTAALTEAAAYADQDIPCAPHARDAQNTKKVSSAVPAAVIRSIWYANKASDVPLPIDMALH